MLKRYWFYIVLLSTLVLQAQAQTTYPIQVNANLLPPYSAYLSDYYSGTREKLTLTLINRDQFKPTLNVRLRMIITAPGGLRLQTNEQSFIEPIIVENGSPVRLTQDDIAPYFQPQNLITQGYMTSGKFPEGMVEFCFQAVEAYTGQALSLSTCTRAWITSQKPPLLSLPRNNESIVFREPLNVLFQWTPLHQGLAQVEYEFILKELWDNGMTPQAAFPYAPEIYRETTRSTSLVYGAMQPPLLAGKRYAWCIRAQARDGMDAVNLFQNDGYSEIRWFTLQDNCAPPEFVMATAEKKRLNVEWTALPDHIGFSVSYRVIKARTSDGKVDASEWKEQQSQEPKVILYGLQSGGTYEYRVGSYCMAGQPVYSPIFTITLPETDSARLAQCGIMPNVNLTNKEPIKELKTGEIIMANDYPVTVTKISGVNGIYTGEGWTIVPWLNDAKIAVQFTSITVNTDKQMINGYIDAKYDKNEGQIANLDDVFEGGFDVGTVKTGITKIDHVLDFSIPGVEAFSLNEEGDLVITDSEGEPHTITPASNEGQGNEGNKVVVFPMTVQDKDGNVYQVEKVTETDATGKEVEKAKATYIGKAGTPLAEGSFDPSQLNGDKAIVTFAKGDGIYGFDTWLDYYDNVSLIENKYQKLYTGYYAPWKLVPVGKTDKVVATIEIKDKNIKPEQVIFKTPKGTEYKATYENGKYALQLAAGPAGDVQELYALYPNGKDKYYTLGKLNIVSYELQKYTVVLVPVNNVPVDKQAIQKTLQDIYGAVGVTWDVIVDANFDYADNYRLMEKSTGLSTYNEDMRALNNAYRSARADNFDKAANYLFFLKATGSEDINDRDATGFMPRGSQFGYIFTSEIKDVNEPITVAHELGHGRWKLFHTFDEHYGGYKKGETENVMDYNNGHHVAKWQWDVMHDPAMLVSIFEGDAASAYRDKLAYKCLPPTLTKISNSEYYYTLDKKVILLNSKYEPYAFVGEDDSNGNFKGALAIIRRKSDGKLYFPAKENEKYPLYYARTSSGGLDVNDKFTDFVEGSNITPTIVKISNNCSYTIQRKGSADVVSKADKCNCFGDGGDGNGSQGEFKIIDKTGENIDLASISDLLSGKLSYTDAHLGQLQAKVAHLYLTSDNNPAAMQEVMDAKVPEGVLKLWVHKTKDNKWIVKGGVDATRLNDIYRNKFRASYAFDINKALENASSDLKAVATATYKIADWLSSKISTLYVPESWWNCNNTEEFGITPDDPRYFNPPWFVDVVKIILSPTDIVVESYIKNMIPDDNPSLAKLKDMSISDLKFALAVGVWDGLVGLIAALPDALKLATMNFADDPGAQKSATEIGKLIDEKGGGVAGAGRMILSSIADQFDANKPCVLAHSIGQVGFDIVVAIFTAGGGTAASRFGSTIRTIVTTLDKLDVLGNVVGSATGGLMKVAFRGTSKVLTFTVKSGAKIIEATLENGKYVIKVFRAAGTAAREIDWSVVRVAQATGPRGERINVPIFVNPAEQIENAVYRIKEILKDENGFEIKNDKGESLAVVEVENTNPKRSEIAVVRGVTKTLAERLSEFKGIAKKIDAFNDAAKRQKFLDDFNNASDDILHKLDADDGALVDMWNIINTKPSLRLKMEVLEALMKLKKNPHLARSGVGINDKLLSEINGWQWGDGVSNTAKASYEEVINNIDRFVTTLGNNSIECSNCNRLWEIFKTGSNTDKQAAFWIMEDVAGDAKTFAKKKLTLEYDVTKSNGKGGRIDLITNDTPPLFVEYKWYGGSDGVARDLFVDEFIRRDLNSITDLRQLQWRVKGNKLTKDKVVEYITGAQSEITAGMRQIFENYRVTKAYPKAITTNARLIEFLNNNNDWFSEIFK